MAETPATIRPLPDEVAAQIKSSTTISSLENVVVELLKNSLDASCHKVEISVDFGRGACTVEDDGLGIKPEEFLDTGGLGKAYPTLIYHHTRPAARLVPAPSRHQLSNREHGTKADVYDLFGNMPVRVKQRGSTLLHNKDHAREWCSMRRSIVALLLAWHTPVTVVLRDGSADWKMVLRSKKTHSDGIAEDVLSPKPNDLTHIRGILSQAGYIEPDVRDTWIKTSARTAFITIRGVFSLQPAPSKRIQFLSLGIRDLSPDSGANVLYDEVNRLFARSSFGNSEELSDGEAIARTKSKDRRYKQDGPTNKQLRGIGKGVDRWPMFVIRIEIHGQGSERFGGRDVLERESTLSSIVKVLVAMTTGFLNDYHFRPRARPKKRRPTSARKSLGNSDSGNSIDKTPVLPSSVGTPISRPRSRPSSESQVSKKAMIMAFGDDTNLNNDIRLPKLQVDRNHYMSEAFSGWSRIKSGTAQGIDDGFLVAATQLGNPHQSDRLLGEVSMTDHRRFAHQLSTPPPESNDTWPTLQPVQDGTDSTIAWINPKTRVPVVLNARTGQTVSLVSGKASTGNGNAISTCEDAILPSAKPTDRLSRCTSAPAAPRPGSWVSNLLKDWHNPVFTPARGQAIQQVSLEGPTLESSDILHGRHGRCSNRDIDKALSQVSTAFSAKLSKEALKNASVIAQVDRKFILVSMPANPPNQQHVLCLIDQHAADERIRVEALLADLHSPPSPETLALLSPTQPQPRIATNTLAKPLTFQISAPDHQLFASQTQHFARWGILYHLCKPPPSSPTGTCSCSITVTHLPPTITARCISHPPLLLDLLRSEIHNTGTTSIATVPRGILDLLNSRACRSAIMFNDVLTRAECAVLVARLAGCGFPFQCAHGRVSLVPLVRVGCDGEIGEGGFGGWDGDGERKGGVGERVEEMERRT
ncbi:MAG: hypothetical protein Q9182_000340 [Xanthomendoza sp. 2 TL-2023]